MFAVRSCAFLWQLLMTNWKMDNFLLKEDTQGKYYRCSLVWGNRWACLFKILLYLLFFFDVWREWMEVSERLRCSAHSTLEREHCFSFEIQSPFCQLSSWKLNVWLICTSHRIMWAVVFKLFTKCQKHILSVQYSQYKAWNYLGFQMLCQPLLQICTIYHRKQSSFGVIWIILQVFYFFFSL